MFIKYILRKEINIFIKKNKYDINKQHEIILRSFGKLSNVFHHSLLTYLHFYAFAN